MPDIMDAVLARRTAGYQRLKIFPAWPNKNARTYENGPHANFQFAGS